MAQNLFCVKKSTVWLSIAGTVRGRSDTTDDVLVMRTAVSVLVVVVMVMRSGVVVFLVQ